MSTPQILEVKNENDLWAHAEPVDEERLRVDRIGEFEFMKELFSNHLPVGKNKEEIDKYFMDLEKVIYTNDYHKIKNDEFPPSIGNECCCGLQHDDSKPTNNECQRRQYKYFSADLLKQQSSRIPGDSDEHSDLCVRFSGYDNELGEEIYDSAHHSSSFRVDQIQGEPERFGHLPRLAERQNSTSSEDWSD